MAKQKRKSNTQWNEKDKQIKNSKDQPTKLTKESTHRVRGGISISDLENF